MTLIRGSRSWRSKPSQGRQIHVVQRVDLNPLDFQRWVAGVSYQYNEYLRFALDSQNLLFYHSQFSVPISYASRFNYVPGGTFNGRGLPSKGSIPNTVPLDTHAIFLNMEFAY